MVHPALRSHLSPAQDQVTFGTLQPNGQGDMGHHAVQAQPRGSASSLFPAEHRTPWSSNQVHEATADPASPFHTRWCLVPGPTETGEKGPDSHFGQGLRQRHSITGPEVNRLLQPPSPAVVPHSLWDVCRFGAWETYRDLHESWLDPSLPGTIAPEAGSQGGGALSEAGAGTACQHLDRAGPVSRGQRGCITDSRSGPR